LQKLQQPENTVGLPLKRQCIGKQQAAREPVTPSAATPTRMIRNAAQARRHNGASNAKCRMHQRCATNPGQTHSVQSCRRWPAALPRAIRVPSLRIPGRQRVDKARNLASVRHNNQGRSHFVAATANSKATSPENKHTAKSHQWVQRERGAEESQGGNVPSLSMRSSAKSTSALAMRRGVTKFSLT